MTRERQRRHRAGLDAERFAAGLLRLKGYRILAQRYKTPVGEIDLIARRGRTVAFIEVKARQRMAQALEAVTPAMRLRIGRAAAYYLSAQPALANLTLRFDLIAVVPPFYWRHLDNAWRPAT